MSTVSERSTNIEMQSKHGPATGWVVAAGLVVVIGFWAGHEYWPKQGVGQLPAGLHPGVGTATVVPSPASQLGIPLAENSIADIAEQTSKSVVNIDTRTSIAISDSPYQMGSPFGGFEFFFGRQMQPFEQRVPRKFESQGSGSGLIVRQDGYILTNNHVVRNATDIKVTLADKRVFSGKIVGRDAFTDLALVKIDASNLPVAKMGSSKTLRPGDWAIAIGSPLGLDHTVTLGIISALGRSLDDLKSNVELIQTDAAINPGNSGGPLLNIKGEVIGINTAVRSDAQNIGFSIPVDVASEVTNGLLTRGTVARPYVGVYMQDLDAKLARGLGLPESTRGVIVARVGPDSPAERAGLFQGDLIQRVDGQVVASSKELQKLVRTHKPGETLNLLVSRGGVLKAIAVKVGDYPVEDNRDE